MIARVAWISVDVPIQQSVALVAWVELLVPVYVGAQLAVLDDDDVLVGVGNGLALGQLVIADDADYLSTSLVGNRSFGVGYWAPMYWHQAYYNETYWADTTLVSVEFLGLQKVGGDDVPYRSRRNKGWNKKAWLKKQKLLLDIEATLRGTPYEFDALGVRERFNVPPEIHIHVADEYDKLLARLREIDDEEAAMLLL